MFAIVSSTIFLVISVYDLHVPIGSMYGIYANIWGILMVNVTIYGIHGSYGVNTLIRFQQSFWMNVPCLEDSHVTHDSRFTCEILNVWGFIIHFHSSVKSLQRLRLKFPFVFCEKTIWNPHFSWLSHLSPIISPGISQLSHGTSLGTTTSRRSFEKASGLVEALIGAVQQVRDVAAVKQQTWWNLDVNSSRPGKP